jgi:tRNA A-37 threonylcarbamoyl transferase component Bud32
VGSDSNTITLDGGSSIAETFRIPTGGAVAGDYIISVSTDDGSDSASVRIEEEVEPANFDVSIDNTNSPVTEGEDLRVDATVTNTGEESDSQRVTAEVPDVDSASETIELDSGSSTTETFTIPTEDGDTGTHSLEISTDDNTDSTSVSIEEQEEPASFDVSVESTNSPVTGGDDLTVDVAVTNTGEQDGTQTVTAEVQGVGSDSERVSLSGGSSTTETLRIPTNTGDDGSYSVSVSTDDDSTSTSVSVSADQPSGDDGDTDGTGENTDDGTGTDGDGGTTGGDGTDTTSEDDGNGGTAGGSNDDSTAGNEGEDSPTDGTEEPTDGSNTNWLVYALGAVGLVGGGYGGYRMLSSDDDEESGNSDRDGTESTSPRGGSQSSRGAGTAPKVDSADEYPSTGSLTYDNIEKVEPIGSGGNADVYRAVAQTKDGKATVAVKEPRMSGTLHIEKAERIMQEAETWDKLDDHNHIVSVIDYGSEPLPWIAMEYMDGGHMGEVTGELGTDQAIWTAVSVTEGVRHAHQKGIAHLDLKPENVLFRSRQDGWDVPKVADWGLSKHLLEHSKSIEGMSPQYAAPEQFDEEYGTADGVTDVYQLGAVFYDLFTGRPPFEGKPTKVMRAVMDDEPVPPSEIADVPPELDEILMKALEKDKEDRYDNILYLRDDLQDMFE